MRSFSLALSLAVVAGLSACSAPPATTGSASSGSSTTYAPPPEGAPSYGPGDTCADTYVIVTDTPRTNFSLGTENYRNNDFCGAYPYYKWLLANDALFTGEDPDDRNYLRMAGIYEYFATQVDSTNQAERKAYLDSALAARRMGRDALDAQGIAYDSYLRDLREGFFYFQNATVYPDAEQQQFTAFNRAFEAKPDSLEDWYLQRLFEGSAQRYGDDLTDRADYVERVATSVDDPALKTYFNAWVTNLRTPPSDPSAAVAGNDTAVQALITKANSGALCGSGNDALILLAVTQQQPERIEALGADPDALQSIAVNCPEILNNVTNPRTLLGLAFREYRAGNSSQGNDFFQRAVANASSNGERADYYYARYARTRNSADITQALQYNPAHGPSLYTRAGFIADAVGRQSSTRGRAAYWCLADIYRNVAASTTDGRIASQARNVAARYERAGPTREQYFLDPGWTPGQTVSASLGSYGSCNTRVR